MFRSILLIRGPLSMTIREFDECYYIDNKISIAVPEDGVHVYDVMLLDKGLFMPLNAFECKCISSIGVWSHSRSERIKEEEDKNKGMLSFCERYFA